MSEVTFWFHMVKLIV